MLPPGLCDSHSKRDYGAVQGLLIHVVCYVYGCSVLCLFSGVDLPTCGWAGFFLLHVLSVSSGWPPCEGPLRLN